MSYRLRFDRRFMNHLGALPGDVRSMGSKSKLWPTIHGRPVPKNWMNIRDIIASGYHETIAWYGR